jgi:DNA-binding transcriptional LysR family regulator
MNAKPARSLSAADLSLVLALARARTLASAAELLGLDLSTVFRRLNELERRVRVRLFERSKRGYHLTSAGERAAAAAERVETELHALDREITGRDQQLTGTLRVTASETLSHSVLPPLFASFRQSHPGIELILTIDNRVLDLGRREADVALRTRRPSQSDLFGRQLAAVAWAFYGGANTHAGFKRDLARLDFSRLSVIGWDQSEARIVASAWIEARVPASRLVYRSNSLVNQLMSVRAGVGIALLPCYLADPVPEVRRLTAPLPQLEGELWIVTHKDLKDTARVRTFLAIVGDGIAAQRALFEGKSKRAPDGARVHATDG